MREIEIDLLNLQPQYECGNVGEANATTLKINISSIKDNATHFIVVLKNSFSEIFCSEKIEMTSVTDNKIELPLWQSLTKTGKEILVVEAYKVNEEDNIEFLRKSPVVNLHFESSVSSDDALKFDREVYGLFRELYTLENDITKSIAAAQTATQSAIDTTNNIIELKNSGAFNGPQGEKGEQGPQGEQGPKGDTGEQGVPGINGQSATIEIGTVETGEPGTSATVTNTGTPLEAILNFTIPKGEKGLDGNETIKQIANVTLSEDVSVFEVSQDIEGKSFAVKNVVLLLRIKGSSQNDRYRGGFIYFGTGDTDRINPGNNRIVEVEGAAFTTIATLKALQKGNGFYSCWGQNADSPSINSGNMSNAGVWQNRGDETINVIKITPDIAGYYLGAGSIIQIWGW